MRLGTIYTTQARASHSTAKYSLLHQDRGEKFFQKLLTWVFGFSAVTSRLPEQLRGLHHMINICKMAGYDVWNMFSQLGTDKIYEAKGVCSARSHGIRGLGTELVRRSEVLAAERGCTHVYALLTGEHNYLENHD